MCDPIYENDYSGSGILVFKQVLKLLKREEKEERKNQKMCWRKIFLKAKFCPFINNLNQSFNKYNLKEKNSTSFFKAHETAFFHISFSYRRLT